MVKAIKDHRELARITAMIRRSRSPHAIAALANLRRIYLRERMPETAVEWARKQVRQ